MFEQIDYSFINKAVDKLYQNNPDYYDSLIVVKEIEQKKKTTDN